MLACCALLAPFALAAPPTIDEQPDGWVVQRYQGGAGWVGDIAFAGSYAGAGAIEARLVNASSGAEVVGWTTVSAGAEQGLWSGSLDGVPQGGWYLLEIRAADDPGDIVQSAGRFGVGLVLATLGQSNMVKMFTEDEADGSVAPPFEEPGPLTRRWGYGEPAGFEYSRPRTVDIPVSWGDVTGAGGIRLANGLADQLGVPVLVLDFAVDWTGLDDHWNNDQHRAWRRLSEALDAVGSVGAFLWHHGAYDVYENGMSTSEYKAGLDTLYGRLVERTGGTPPMLVAIQNRGDYDQDPGQDPLYDAVRRAQFEWIDERAHAFAAGTTVDLDLTSRPGTGDGHFWARSYQEAADRYLRALLHVLGEGGYEDGVDGASLADATVRGSTVIVEITHGAGSRLQLPFPSLDIEGFALTDGDWEVGGEHNHLEISSAVLSDQLPGNHVVIELAEPPAGPLRLRYLAGQNAFFYRATKEERRRGGNVLLDDFPYHPERPGLPVHGTVEDVVVQEAGGIGVDVAQLEVPEGGSAELFVRLLDAPAAPVLVEAVTVGDADLQPAAPSLLFDAGNWSVPQSLLVTAAADADGSDGEALLRLRAADQQPALVELLERDAAPRIELVPSSLSLSRFGGSASFEVSLGTPPEGPVTIDIETDINIGSELEVAPDRLVFDSSDWHLAQTVIVSSTGGAMSGESSLTSLVLQVDSASSAPSYAGLPPLELPVELVGYDDGLLAHWPLDETAGEIAADVSGTGQHGLYGSQVTLGQVGVVGSAVATAGPGGGAGSLDDGVSGAGLAGGAYEELTAAFWYRLPSPDTGYLFTWGGSYNRADTVSLYLDAGDEIRVRVHDAADSTSVESVAPAGFDDDSWHHVAVVKDNSGSRLYFDGALELVTTAGDGPIAPPRGVTLGTNEFGTYGLVALFDDLRLYDRALGDGEIAALAGDFSAALPASLTVELAPSAAVAAGARWRVAGEDWQESGETISLVEGEYSVEFEAVAGWTAPAAVPITLEGGDELALDIDYRHAEGLLWAWPLDTAIDVSGFDRHPQPGSGVVTGLPGVDSTSMATAGPGGSSGSPALTITGPDEAWPAFDELTVALWYRLEAAHDGYLFSWGGSYNDPNHLSAYLDTDDGLRLRVHDAGDRSSVLQVQPAGFADGWHHLALVSDGAGSRVYVNGQLAGSSAMGAGAVQPAGFFRLGANEHGTYGLEARFDEVRAYDVALDAAAVQQLYAQSAYGQLLVELTPAEAVAAGARWQLDGDVAWRAGGGTLTLPAGEHDVVFEPIDSWLEPPTATVWVRVAETAHVTGEYLPDDVPSVGALLYWPLDSADPGLDASGNGHHATVGALVASGLEGVVDEAVQTAGYGGPDGTLDDLLYTGDLAADDSYVEATVAFWYRLPAEPHDGYLFSWGGSYNNDNHISAYLDVGTELRVRVRDAGDTSSVLRAVPAAFDDTAWHHLVVVKDELGSTVYVDGAAIASGSVGAGVITPSLGFYLGANPNAKHGLEASFDELQVFDRALDSDAIEALAAAAPPVGFGGDYHDTDEIYLALEQAALDYADIVELVDYGDSWAKSVGGHALPNGHFLAGDDLVAARVTRRDVAGDKPVMILMACLHAREIATPELALRLLAELTEGYGVDADITWLVDHHELWILPLSNPDGHRMVAHGALPENGSRPWSWRKNLHDDGECGWPPQPPATDGVDLNRNFPYSWGTSGGRAGASNECGAYYRGQSAGSEPETEGIMDLVSSLITDGRGEAPGDAAPVDKSGLFIQLHSPFRTIAWPWAHSGSPPPNADGLRAVGEKLAAIAGYDSGQAHEAIYEMTGTADDWVYGELGAASLLMEVGEGLMPAYHRVDNVLWPETRGAMLYAAKLARAPYLEAHGPETAQLAAVPEAGGFRLDGVADDSESGALAVQAAEAYVGVPPWSGGAVAIPLDAADGAYGDTSEALTGFVSSSGLAPGRHTVWVRAQDAGGSWGPPSAVFIDVD